MRVAMLGLSETVPVYFDEVTMAHAEGEVLLNGSMKVRVLARCIADEFGARGRVIEVCGVNLDTLNGDELVGFAIPRALYEAAGAKIVSDADAYKADIVTKARKLVCAPPPLDGDEYLRSAGPWHSATSPLALHHEGKAIRSEGQRRPVDFGGL